MQGKRDWPGVSVVVGPGAGVAFAKVLQRNLTNWMCIYKTKTQGRMDVAAQFESQKCAED
jgi:hypothetical protein